MLSKPVPSVQETSSKSKSKVSPQTPPLRFLSEPQLLPGEDSAAYEQFFARMYSAVKPADVIEEMFVAEIVSLQWEVSRYRQLKLNLIQEEGIEALQNYLAEQLDYELYREHFADDLAETLRSNFPEDQAESAQTLAREYTQDDPKAVAKVTQMLDGIGLDMYSIMHKAQARAQARKAKELVQGYVRRQPSAVALLKDLLARAGASVHAFMAGALAEKIDLIERIDRLTNIAESRRNASLHEINRRRAVLGEALRRSVQEIEDAEFEVIKMAPKEKPRVDERPQD